MFHVLQFFLIFSVTIPLHFSPIDVKRSRVDYGTSDGIYKKLNLSALADELTGGWEVNSYRTMVFDSFKNHVNSASPPCLSKEDYSIEDNLKTKRFCLSDKGVKACLEVEFKRKPKEQVGKRLRDRRDANSDDDFPISDDTPSDEEEYKDDMPDNDFGDGQTKNRTDSANKHVVVKVPQILSGSENYYDIAKNSSGTKLNLKNVPKLGDGEHDGSDYGGGNLAHPGEYDGELSIDDNSGSNLGDDEYGGSDSGSKKGNLDQPEEYNGEFSVDDNSGSKLRDEEYDGSDSEMKKKNLDHSEEYDGKFLTDGFKLRDKEHVTSDSGRKKKNIDHPEEYDGELRIDYNSGLKLGDEEHVGRDSGWKKKNPNPEEYDGEFGTDYNSRVKLEDKEHDRSASGKKKKNLDRPEEYDGELPTDDNSGPKLGDEEHDESDSGMKKKNLDHPEEYEGELPIGDNSGSDNDGDEYVDANGEDGTGKQSKPHIETRSHRLQDEDEKHDAKLNDDGKQEFDYADDQEESYLSGSVKVKSTRGGKRIGKVGAKSVSLNDSDDDASDSDEYSRGGNKYGTKHGGAPGRRIGSSGSGLKGHYYPKRNEAPYDWNRCKVPAGKNTYESLCKMMPGGVKCNLYCIFGHTFPEGIERKTSCSHQSGKWTRPFVDCIPFVDCTLQMRSAGTLKCKTNSLKEGTGCTVSCERYGVNGPSRKRTYTCTSSGSWKPRLPHCVKPQGINIVPPPRFRNHKEIRYP